MSDPLHYLTEHGMTLEEIRQHMANDISLEELADAVGSMEARGELPGYVDVSKLLSDLANAKTVRELMTDSVKNAYRAAGQEQRAFLHANLREIAKAGRFTKEFDIAFDAFKKSAEEENRAASDLDKGTHEIRVSIETVADALNAVGVTIRYNQLLKEIEVSGLPDCYSQENAVNILPVYLYDYLKASGYSGVTMLAVEGCLNCIADKNRYNPIREYLFSGEWDGVDRFCEIYRILGVTAPRHQMYIRKWFIQCVALGLNDDGDNLVGAEGALVLQGDQGLAKTSFFRIMSPFPRWFVEGAIIDMRDKDTQIKALRGWICELGELDGTVKKDQSSLKAFITLPEDRIRMPYARGETRAPRRTSFCGTVNPKDYLRDDSGSRRFWTVPLTNVDKKALFSLQRSWVNQLWYQTYKMYQENPDGFRMTDFEIKELQVYNKGFEQPLPYEMEIMEMLDFSLPSSQWEWWRAAEIARFLPGVADAKRVGKALSKIARDYAQLNSPNPPNSTRLHLGYQEYLVPIRHFDRFHQETGGTRCYTGG